MFKQSDSESKEVPSKETSKVNARTEKTGNKSPAIIGADVRLTGNLQTSGEVLFDGSIEGDLDCGILTIGDSAKISGNIIADTVTIHGQITGTIRAKNVRLEKGAKVLGDILHEDLAVASGAHIEGQVKRVENAITGAKPAPVAAKPAAPQAAE